MSNLDIEQGLTWIKQSIEFCIELFDDKKDFPAKQVSHEAIHDKQDAELRDLIGRINSMLDEYKKSQEIMQDGWIEYLNMMGMNVSWNHLKYDVMEDR